jgi:hypothetical protein
LLDEDYTIYSISHKVNYKLFSTHVYELGSNFLHHIRSSCQKKSAKQFFLYVSYKPEQVP